MPDRHCVGIAKEERLSASQQERTWRGGGLVGCAMAPGGVGPAEDAVLVPGFVLVLREHSKHGQRQRHRRRLNWHLARLRARARVCGRLPGRRPWHYQRDHKLLHDVKPLVASNAKAGASTQAPGAPHVAADVGSVFHWVESIAASDGHDAHLNTTSCLQEPCSATFEPPDRESEHRWTSSAEETPWQECCKLQGA